MAEKSTQAEVAPGSFKKRRGSYLTYLSNPSEKVPRTSEYRQKLSSGVSLSFQDKSSPDNCQTNDNAADGNSYERENDENDSWNDCDGFVPLEEISLPTEIMLEEQFMEGCFSNTNVSESVCTSEVVEQSTDDLSFWASQDFIEDPALVTSETNQDLDNNGKDEDLEDDDKDESDHQDSFVKISELPSLHNKPLYTGSPVTFSVSLLLIITFAMRHNLTGIALADLLTLINVHLLVPNCFAKSTAVLNRFFRQLKKPIEYHYYCSFCYQYIGLQKVSCCSNKYCLKDFTKKGALAYFIVLPLIVQLRSLLASKYYYR